MYETVKLVNGYEIYRAKGTKKCYHIRLDAHREIIFSTIKSATVWALAH